MMLDFTVKLKNVLLITNLTIKFCLEIPRYNELDFLF